MIQLPRTKARAGKAAYSLIELVVALGILAIALPMVAAVFLPGALENAESIKHTMGTLVAENALAIVRARVSHADLVDEFGAAQMGQPERIPETLVPLTDLEWNPARGTGQTVQPLYGCVVAVQRLAGGRNDYRLIAIPYRKFLPAFTVKDVVVQVDANGMVTRHDVLLDDPAADDQHDPTESADIGFLVQRTAMRAKVDAPSR